ncbi:MAG: HEPN domain-containing protein [Methanomassiliicoccaceae archaeon]|nr:HEPN domain-containing protein [Methanomassiliicoccaceae archaeon]
MVRSEDIGILKLRASEDLRVAKMIIDADDELSAHIGFNLQQFLEKTMKASLMEHDVKYPKTHDLAILLKLFPQEKISEEDKIFTYVLSQFAVESRYGHCPSSPWDGQQMLEKSKKFAEFIETLW